MSQLHSSIKTVWRIQLLVPVVLFSVLAFFFYDLTGWLGNADRFFPFGVLSGSIFVLGMIYSIVWPYFLYKYFNYELLEKEMIIEQGPLTRVKTMVPFRRIQHLDVSQNVLEREFDLGKLIVYTAGTQNNRVELPGLEFEEAERLRATVRSFITESAV